MAGGVATCGSTGTISGSGFANRVCNGDRRRNFGLVNGRVLFFERFSSFPARIVDYQDFWKPSEEK
jgi:hypothetical protein